MHEVVKMQFGSHLYGTNTPDSDTDYKGIYLPSKKEVYLGTIPQSISLSRGKNNEKNTSADTDDEMYSLHYFLKLAKEGQTVALDMLHSEPRHWLLSTSIWEELVRNRTWFYTKNLQAFVGYARTQAAKYGIKGSRLASAKRARDFFVRYMDHRVARLWDQLWEDEHCHFLHNGVHRIWQVCGKGVSETMKGHEAATMLTIFIEHYGDRAKKAERNEGIDFKAVSHALRAGYQARSILIHGGFSFPLPEVNFLRDIKSGKLNYLTEVVPKLEELMEELEKLSAQSTLPNKVNHAIIDEWLIKTLEREYQC